MNNLPQRRKSLREWLKGQSVWSKIGWTILLGYIVGRILYWIAKLVTS